MKSEKYVVMGTKTSPDFARIFRRICDRKGIKPYQAIQMMVDTFVRYTDDRHNLSANMEHTMMLFEHMEGWQGSLNLADPTPEKHISEAIYFLTADKRNGSRAVMVHRPWMGKWTETSNIQIIMERVVEVLLPERYRRLRALAIDRGCNSILELLDQLIDAQTEEQINEQFRREFSDNNRSEFGKPIEYGQRTKRRHHKTIDALAQQSIIHFSNEDIPELQ